MKKKLVIAIIWMCMISFAGCGENNEINKSDVKIGENDEKLSGSNMLDKLTEEQKNYLINEMYYTEDRINETEYEALNWELLGTGFELYNQSSGVEKYGVTYEETEPIGEVSKSDVLITMEEVISIRKKEKNMRLNDFAVYKYYLDTSGEWWGMEVPIADYEDTYVYIGFKKDENNIINMQAPFIKHERGTPDSVFSILYTREVMRQYYEVEPKYQLTGKTYIQVQYTSVTDNSLVLELFNHTENKYKLVSKYELYEITDSGQVLLDSSDGTESDMRAGSYSIEGIKFEKDVKIENGKTYLIKFGENKKGYFYDEIEFSKD